MKQKLLDIIKENPRHYTRIVAKDPHLSKWVLENTRVSTVDWPPKIYSALHGVDDSCVYGNKRKFDRISTGFTGCGPAAVCKCTAEQISKQTAFSKNLVSADQKKVSNELRSKTMHEKYGVAYNSQRSDIKHIWTKAKISETALSKLTDLSWMTVNYVEQERTLVDIADELGVYYSTVAEYCKELGFKIRQTTNYSQEEKQISQWLTSLGISHIIRDWELLGNREIDIYIPSHHLAIEINGLYWHSWHPNTNKIENRKRHIEKTLDLIDKGIQLIHVTDYDWHKNTEIIKSIIMSKLGLTTKIYARHCQLKTVTSQEQKKFLNENHLQGYIKSKFALGLYYDGELVQMASFGKPRFDRKYNLELLRFCSTKNITVTGGLSKLLFHTKTLNKGSIITYCDSSRSQANGYTSVGFKMIRTTDPGYFWTDGNGIISRYMCQRKHLQCWLKSYDSNLSESENMFAAGYRRYWDCGNYVLVLE